MMMRHSGRVWLFACTVVAGCGQEVEPPIARRIELVQGPPSLVRPASSGSMILRVVDEGGQSVDGKHPGAPVLSCRWCRLHRGEPPGGNLRYEPPPGSFPVLSRHRSHRW